MGRSGTRPARLFYSPIFMSVGRKRIRRAMCHIPMPAAEQRVGAAQLQPRKWGHSSAGSRRTGRVAMEVAVRKAAGAKSEVFVERAGTRARGQGLPTSGGWACMEGCVRPASTREWDRTNSTATNRGGYALRGKSERTGTETARSELKPIRNRDTRHNQQARGPEALPWKM